MKMLNSNKYNDVLNKVSTMVQLLDCGYMAFNEAFKVALSDIFNNSFAKPLFEAGGVFSIDIDSEEPNSIEVKFKVKDIQGEFQAYLVGYECLVIVPNTIDYDEFIVKNQQNALSVLVSLKW